MELGFSRPTNFPSDIIRAAEKVFDRLFSPRLTYRSTGVVLLGLEAANQAQLDLFGESFHVEKMERLFQCVDALKEKYGKHTLFLGSSFLAHKHAQHAGERGEVPLRRERLLKGETKRKRLGIPMFLGEVK